MVNLGKCHIKFVIANCAKLDKKKNLKKRIQFFTQFFFQNALKKVFLQKLFRK